MANLKELRNRISSVISTRKITRAMQMVAASKLRRAQNAILASRPYAQAMHKSVSTLAARTPKGQLSRLARMIFDPNEKAQTHLLIVVSSQRGLCGGFNTHIIRLAQNEARRLIAQGQEVKFLCVGKKSFDSLQRQWGDKIIDVLAIPPNPLDLADNLSQRLVEDFTQQVFNRALIFYSRFQSVLSQHPTAYHLIPIEKKHYEDGQSIYSYEPDESQMLDSLLIAHLKAQLLRALLENAAGEQGARMTAMDSATRNAEDMIERLSLIYNRTRQAGITKELTEIISGAEAL